MPRETKPKVIPSGIITAMFTDIVDSTAIKGQMEGETSARRDAQFREQIKEPHDEIVLDYVHQAGGYVVNPTGDGFCITFVDAEEAVLCGLRIQQYLRLHPIATPTGALQIRIGLHTGIAGPSGDDYIAATVDKTARVQSQSGGGQVFVSHQTQVLVADKIKGVHFEPRGIFDLKGLQAEELYQAIPSQDLDLSRLTPGFQDANDQAAAPTATPKSDWSRRVQLVGVGCALLFIGVLATFFSSRPQTTPTVFPTSSSALSPAAFTVGSQWNGSFHFLPPMESYDGSVAIKVTKRQGDDFQAVYSTEHATYQWIIAGTIKGTKLKWDFVKALKNPGKEDAVGKAHGDATIEGNRMKGFFRMRTDTQEVAALDLLATE